MDWKAGQQIVLTSTSFDQEDTETARIAHVHPNGTTVELEFPLQFEHVGDGWSIDGPDAHAGHGWAEDGDSIPEYSAEVGLLSRNVVVEGDYHVTRRQEFGVQIVLASRGDLSLTARITNAEVRLAGWTLSSMPRVPSGGPRVAPRIERMFTSTHGPRCRCASRGRAAKSANTRFTST